MNATYFAIYALFVSCFLFLTVVAVANKDWFLRSVSTVAFLVGMASVYFSTGSLLGQAKPFWEMPYWDNYSLEEESISLVLGGAIRPDQGIFLLLQPSDQAWPRLYVFAYTPELAGKLKKAIEENKRVNGSEWNFNLKLKPDKEGRGKGAKPKFEKSLELRDNEMQFEIPQPMKPPEKPSPDDTPTHKFVPVNLSSTET